MKALHSGPWFVIGHFLIVRRWEPNFVLAETKLSSTIVSIRLSQLPTEFYDKKYWSRLEEDQACFLKLILTLGQN